MTDVKRKPTYRIVNLQAENVKRLKAVSISPDGNIVEITGRNKQGKQQPVSEPVLTPLGWVPIGTVVPGDLVIGASGKPTKVAGVFPQTDWRTFDVVMKDGGRTRCGPDHLWTVYSWSEGKSRRKHTLSTLQMIERGVRSNKGTSRRWSVQTAGPVEFSDLGENLPIDPYTLGVILGDGHIQDTGYVTITSWDDDLLDGLGVADAYRSTHNLGTSKWSRPLSHLGLAGRLSYDKFIPTIYLRGSTEDRWALLCGLMDTDGTADKCWASFCSTSERLADGVVDLARSLGCIATKSVPRQKSYRYKGELKRGLNAWNVAIKSDATPFRLRRKIAAWRPSTIRGDLFRLIDRIEPTADEQSVCIKVEAEDGLYVTKDFIVTHNTSILDSLWWALTGASNIQTTPIRKGEEKAKIVLNLGALVITRKFNAKEGGGFTSSITVASEDGMLAAKPINFLSELVDELTLDPLAFARSKPKDQFELLKGFVPGIDFVAIERANRQDFDARTEVNRKVKDYKSQVAAIEFPDDTPDQQIDVDALTDELQKAGEHNTRIEQIKGGHRAHEAEIARLGREADAHEQQGADYRKLAEEADAKAAELRARRDDAKKVVLEALPDPIDPAEITAQLQHARIVNGNVAKRHERNRLLRLGEAAEAESAALTKAIEDRDAEKSKGIAAAKMPIEGLGFAGEAVTLNGLPFDQASDAEQLSASIAIALAGNPRLKVLRIRDGSLLDDDSMRLLGEMADKYDVQVWLETVSSGRKGAIVIEDGMVVDAMKVAAE